MTWIPMWVTSGAFARTERGRSVRRLFLSCVLGLQLGAASQDDRIPAAWLEVPMTRVPHHVPVAGWTNELKTAEPGFLVLPASRIFMEVPPGETLRAELRTSWDASQIIAMEADAWWKFGMSFSKQGQSFRNRGKASTYAWVGLASPAGGTANIYVEGHQRGYTGYSGFSPLTGTSQGGVMTGRIPFIPGSGGLLGPRLERPWKLAFTRSWDISRWREARAASAPSPAELPERLPAALKPSFVPGRPNGGGLVGEAEATLVLDPQGRPWAVHPGQGNPELVARLCEWAWQLNFEALEGLGAARGVRVPLKVSFQADPVGAPSNVGS